MLTILFWLCLLLPLVMRFAPSLVAGLWLRLRGKHKELLLLRSEISVLKKEQSQISMMDEFAKHSKLGRKIRTKTDVLKTLESQQAWTYTKTLLVCKVLFYIAMSVLMLVYRNEPVAVFDIDEYTDNVFIYFIAYVLAFPTGVVGCIGLPIGFTVCYRMTNKVLDIFDVKKDYKDRELISEPVD